MCSRLENELYPGENYLKIMATFTNLPKKSQSFHDVPSFLLELKWLDSVVK